MRPSCPVGYLRVVSRPTCRKRDANIGGTDFLSSDDPPESPPLTCCKYLAFKVRLHFFRQTALSTARFLAFRSWRRRVSSRKEPCMNWNILIFALTALCTSACLEVTPQTLCSTDADCFDGYACDETDSRSCLRACDPSATAECLSSESCVASSADDSTGVCKPNDEETTDTES